MKITTFFLITNIGTLLSMQENAQIKDAFSRLEESQQKLVCDSAKNQRPFAAANDAHAKQNNQKNAKWDNQNAVYMFKEKEEDRVVIFKGSCRFEVLISAFNNLCATE